jgi:tripeptidyl-peptidase-1
MTLFLQGPEAGSTEIACSADTNGVITSGGGFSNVYGRPSWQKEFVTEYFNSVTTSPSSGYNTTGRGYPDVSLMARRYVTIVGGDTLLQSGVVSTMV